MGRSIWITAFAACLLCSAASTSQAWAQTGDDELIAVAKTEIKKLLRDPESAQFSGITIKLTGTGSKKVVCGEVNAKNGFGGLTGAIPFFSDGQRSGVIVFDKQTGNSTSFSPYMLGVIGPTLIDFHNRFCRAAMPPPPTTRTAPKKK